MTFDFSTHIVGVKSVLTAVSLVCSIVSTPTVAVSVPTTVIVLAPAAAPVPQSRSSDPSESTPALVSTTNPGPDFDFYLGVVFELYPHPRPNATVAPPQNPSIRAYLLVLDAKGGERSV